MVGAGLLPVCSRQAVAVPVVEAVAMAMATAMVGSVAEPVAEELAVVVAQWLRGSSPTLPGWCRLRAWGGRSSTLHNQKERG